MSDHSPMPYVHHGSQRAPIMPSTDRSLRSGGHRTGDAGVDLSPRAPDARRLVRAFALRVQQEGARPELRRLQERGGPGARRTFEDPYPQSLRRVGGGPGPPRCGYWPMKQNRDLRNFGDRREGAANGITGPVLWLFASGGQANSAEHRQGGCRNRSPGFYFRQSGIPSRAAEPPYLAARNGGWELL